MDQAKEADDLEEQFRSLFPGALAPVSEGKCQCYLCFYSRGRKALARGTFWLLLVDWEKAAPEEKDYYEAYVSEFFADHKGDLVDFLPIRRGVVTMNGSFE